MKKTNRVGVITFQYNNYGTKLQNFAMIKALQKIGVEPKSIYIKHRKDTYRSIVRDFVKYPVNIVINKRSAFSEFTKKHLNRFGTLYKNLNGIDSQFDYFIAGSDQIWNPSHLTTRPKDEKLLFLKFAQKNKRIAYAPSFGTHEINNADLKEMYRSNLNNFAFLSVREPAGQEIIRSIINKSVPIMPDPTFLLDKHDWLSIAEPYNKRYLDQKYVAVYFLSPQDKKINKQIEEYAQSKGFSIIRIAGDAHIDKDSIIPGPDEFMSIISNSRALFTDSFHGAVFSIIMQTPFVVYHRTDVKQHSRIDNLLNMFKLGPTRYNNEVTLESTLEGQDFNKVDGTLKQLRVTGINYLNNALKSKRSQ